MMTPDQKAGYTPFTGVPCDDRVQAWVTTQIEDPSWDTFLNGTRYGQYQQSSMWACTKAAQGWEVIRVLLTEGEQIKGGLQVLTRPSRRGRIGYVSKGPVTVDEDPELCRILVSQLRHIAKMQRLIALIVQPPDHSSLLSDVLARAQFSANSPIRTIESTLLVDVTQGIGPVLARMHSTTRKAVRQGLRRGVTVRVADREDVAVFFELMVSSCRRQNQTPNPPSESAMRSMWDALQRGGHLCVWLAEYDGVPIAGQLCIPFGERVVLFKKGSLAGHHDRRANHVLHYEAFKWAAESGYHFCDFAGLDRRIAEAILGGRSLTTSQKQSRDCFNLGFGGTPVLLPPTRIYVPNAVLRLAGSVVFPWLRRAREIQQWRANVPVSRV